MPKERGPRKVTGLRFGKPFDAPKRRSSHSKVRESSVQTLELSQGSFERNGVVEFKLVLNDNEWARFLPNPFFLKYKLTRKNAEYDTDDTESYKKLEDLEVTQEVVGAASTSVIIPPDQGMAALFSKVEVLLDQVKIGEETFMSGHNCIYQALNRLFSTNKQKVRMQQPSSFLTGEDRTTATKPKYKEASALSNHENFTGSAELISTFTLDGNFAISPPKNFALAQLEGTASKNNNKFFPPHSTIVIRLHPRIPRFSLADWSLQPTADLLNSGVSATDPRKALTLVEPHLGMQYERLIFDQPVGSGPAKNRESYSFDTPFLDKISLEEGHQQIRLTSYAPPGTKLVYITFMKEHQMWYNETYKKNLSNYFQFPPALDTVSAKLAGHGEIFGGLTQLGGNKGFKSVGAKTYFAYLASLGLVDFDFPTMFPASFTTVEPLSQVLLADLRPYNITGRTSINITLDFDGTKSPPATKLVVCYVTSQKVTPSKTRRWKMEPDLH